MLARRAFLAGGGLLIAGRAAAAAQPTVVLLCAAALRSSVAPLVADFQRQSGGNVTAEYRIINAIADRLRRGERADLAIISAPLWEALDKAARIDPAVRTVLARVGYGVFVRKGAARPDIGTVEAFKRALLDARSIAVPARPGPIRGYETRLFDQLGITAAVTPKFKYPRLPAAGERVRGPLILQLVADGAAELGLATTVEIREGAGVELAGPVPRALQQFIVFTAAIPKDAADPAAAKALIAVLTSAKAAALMQSKGFEPGPVSR